MDIFSLIKQSQTLLQQLPLAISNNDGSEIQTLLIALAHQLDDIKINSSAMQQQIIELQKNKSIVKEVNSLSSDKPDMASGCYIFTGEKGFFCPRCYDNHDNKVATRRLNSKLRICPICRTSIK